MKLNATISKLLTNNLLLKVIFVISILNIIGYLFYRNINAVIIFILIGGLVRYFSKNMIIILAIPLLLVNLFMLGQYNNNRTFEGMENNTTTDNSSAEIDKKKALNNKLDNNAINNNDINNDINKNIESNNKDKINVTTTDKKQTTDSNKKLETIADKKATDEPFEAGRKRTKNNIDYASTIEDAYDELNKIIGSDGIKKLTGDTQNLMQQQLQLAEAMKGMAPLIANMEPLIESMTPMLRQAEMFMGKRDSDVAHLAKKFNASS